MIAVKIYFHTNNPKTKMFLYKLVQQMLEILKINIQ